MSEPPILKMRDVSFSYSAGRFPVLADISFEVSGGEIIGVTGASGTGKTTLLRLAAKVLRPAAGLVSGPDQSERDFAFSPQGDVLLEFRTVFENATLLLERSDCAEPAIQSRVQALEGMMIALRLAEKRDQLPASISGGMRQRVQFLQALATQARIVLLDEPFAQQDRDNHHAMEDLLVSAIRGANRSALLVSHDVESLAAVCDHVLFLGGAPARLFEQKTAPEQLRSLDARARRADASFADYNSALWADRARGALL